MKDHDARRLSNQLRINYTAALRLVKQARRYASQYNVSYPEAERHVLTQSRNHQRLTDSLHDAVDRACTDLLYQEVDADSDGRMGHRTPFSDLTLPHSTVENMAVDHIDPDYNAIAVSIDDQYEGGTRLITVRVPAVVVFDGYVHRSVGYHLQDTADPDIHVRDVDWNEHMSQVSLARNTVLEFHGVLYGELSEIDHLVFAGAAEPDFAPPYPH
ncbi:hypothetical protein [Kutzneria sp. NPDC051319]|uniref:hypothetical protein n=1 Tax=Kutzneria sp. NPDC051319 TaxID=3155047 RepID=UPI003437446F